MKSLLIVAALILSIGSANAVTCKQVRQAVERFGSDAVIYWARVNGYSEQRIARLAKVCLK